MVLHQLLAQPKQSLIGRYGRGACTPFVIDLNQLYFKAAAGLYKYGVTANCVAPAAKSRMSGEVPMAFEMGEPEDVAPIVTYLLSDKARHITGQIYHINGGDIGVYNQPGVTRHMWKERAWTAEEIADKLDILVGQEPLPIIERLRTMAKAAAEKKAQES